jgi:hypothetical protein
MEDYSKRSVDEKMIQEVLKIQNLIKEMNSEETNKDG